MSFSEGAIEKTCLMWGPLRKAGNWGRLFLDFPLEAGSLFTGLYDMLKPKRMKAGKYFLDKMKGKVPTRRSMWLRTVLLTLTLRPSNYQRRKYAKVYTVLDLKEP